ncbi:hypothetical protein SM0020_19622 [Sinorhizobium meliloti CCNWSX0020]|uniref:HipA-like C-terminal domain-containing protein n=2 Tax=Sinorhizobium TaxID=28105 RepID=H0G378_RHIML|nr:MULTISPECIES: HipA domain-containing protein [Sinorhizobium]EHK76241.1 hypothetical protein SM0020_19622 [Sinorhizobium meliloti CCNWSX0020]WHS92362.1 HipA domain-containing protein [Sinorhizobium kummerowiae]WRW47599.1 HipA domain-containing protein [Sinorhizobium kummerowiae]
MVARHRVRQLPSQIVDVAQWRVDPDNPYYPEGKQPKRLLISPEANLPPFLLPGHKYLFKTPSGWQERQVWSELIAYELSRPAGLDVPPCFLAVDSLEGETGVLVEFFYGYRGEASLRFVPGSDFIHAWIASGYDRKRGRPHAVRSNLTIARSLGIDAPKDWWARAYFFDALIGNVDRHPDNWGVLGRPTVGNEFEYRMAPLFDNGSSLSYGETDDHLSRLTDLNAYIRRGRHHCGWEGADPKGDRHLDLCQMYVQAYHPAGLLDEFVIRFTDDAITEVLDWCRGFECSIEFTELRANFLRSLLIRRSQLLTSLCEDDA